MNLLFSGSARVGIQEEKSLHLSPPVFPQMEPLLDICVLQYSVHTDTSHFYFLVQEL